MNIFSFSRHPRINARALDDKRLRKMVIETAQLLCTGLNKYHGDQVTPYKSIPKNHNPTVQNWVFDNWKYGSDCWLWRLGIAYGDEIIYRFGKKHASHLVLEGLTFKWPHLDNPRDGHFREHELCQAARHKKLGLDFTHLPTFEAYRAYLNARWPGDKRKPVWTRRNPPRWAEL